MNFESKPNFAAWSLENLSRFASDAFDDMVAKQTQIKDLQLDRDTLLEALHQMWKESN